MRLDPATDEITGTHQLPDAITNALTYNPETGDFYALTYVNELFALPCARLSSEYRYEYAPASPCSPKVLPQRRMATFERSSVFQVNRVFRR